MHYETCDNQIIQTIGIMNRTVNTQNNFRKLTVHLTYNPNITKEILYVVNFFVT